MKGRRHNRAARGSERVCITSKNSLTKRATRSLPLAALFFAFCLNASAQPSWRKQQTGTFAWLHSVFFVDESKGWAVGGKGALLSTTDGGAHWETRPRPAEDALQDIFFTDER